MDTTFLIKLLLSLVVGSTWVTITTVISEKVSGKIGGLIAGLPFTAAISLLFVGVTQDIDASIEATTVVPLSTGFYTYFYLSYLLATKKGFTKGLVIALCIWIFFAFIASVIDIQNFFISVIVWIILVSTSILFAVKYIPIDPKASRVKVEKSPLWIKIVLSSTVIGFIVVISKIVGPVWGGIFSTFPTLAISTFLITIRSGGIEFTRLIAKNILISTTVTVGLYAILVRFLYPELGLILGTIVSYLLLFIFSVPLYILVFEKLRKKQ